MKTHRLFSATLWTIILTLGFASQVVGQGVYIAPSSITEPSHEAQYNQILMPTAPDTISIVAAKHEHAAGNNFVYLLEDGNQGTRLTTLDEREGIFLVEDLSRRKIAVRFGAFHTSMIEVKIYNEDRQLVFWEKSNEVFAGEQIILDYADFDGGKYFLHVNTNDGPVIRQHLYKTYQAYTAMN